MAPQQHPEDFNAFGYDPRGRVANASALLLGENWRPDQRDIPRYHGPGMQIAPPRFGPPADYQQPHLPNGFIPHLPHDGYLGALQYQRREGPWAGYPPPAYQPLQAQHIPPPYYQNVHAPHLVAPPPPAQPLSCCTRTPQSGRPSRRCAFCFSVANSVSNYLNI